MPTRLAILDDEPAFADQMARYLAAHGMPADVYTEPDSLLAALAEATPKLILLDLLLGTTTGLEVLRRIRVVSDVPCIMLTGLADHIDRVVGLESGADDYIAKDAAPREIVARIRAVLRRTEERTAAPTTAPRAAPPAADGAEAIGGSRWQFSPRRRELRRPDGTEVALTTAEFELLRVLHEAAGTAVSRDDLYAKVLRRAYRAEDRSIDNLVAKLRRKIDDPAAPSRIKAVRPVGYVFTGFDTMAEDTAQPGAP